MKRHCPVFISLVLKYFLVGFSGAVAALTHLWDTSLFVKTIYANNLCKNVICYVETPDESNLTHLLKLPRPKNELKQDFIKLFAQI